MMLATFLRCESTEAMADWSLTSLQLELFNIGACFVRHARAITCQLTEIAITDPMVGSVVAIRRLQAPPPYARPRSGPKLNGSGGTGLCAARKKPPPDRNAAASRPAPPNSGSLRDRRRRPGRAMLVQRADSGDLAVGRHPAWECRDKRVST